MREHDRRVAQQSAPVAGVMRTVAGAQAQREVDRAARAEEYRRARGGDARAVGGDQHVGRERVALLAAQRVEARRPGFLAHLDQQLRVEAEPAAARGEHARQRGQVDRVLALVVGAAAAVPAIAVGRERPRRQRRAPLRVVAAHDIAVAVDQHGRQRVVFVARREQERAAAVDGVVDDPRRETEAGGLGRDLVGQIGAQRGVAAAFLAFGAQADAAAQGCEERTGFELVQRVLDGGGTAQSVSPVWFRCARAVHAT